MPLIDIPVEFEYEGIQFSGTFTTSKGNENMWDLSLNKRHYGSLVKYSTGWQWCPTGRTPMFFEDYMENFFIEKVTGFLKS